MGEQGNSSVVKLALLRGVCQTPAYTAHDAGLFAEAGIESEIEIAATASLVPARLAAGECDFAVMPWTRVAAADGALVAIAGSGLEEAAIVVRSGIELEDVRRVAVPLRGGIKDLTAMGMIRSLGWEDVDLLRQPSGDGAIISLFAQGTDAASMVEPYATAMEALGVGRVVRRTGDLWPGAPGCSLTTTRRLRDSRPELVAAVVSAFARGVAMVRSDPGAAAQVAHRHIGVNPEFIEAAIEAHPPSVDAIRNRAAVDEIIGLMIELGYLDRPPADFLDLGFLDRSESALAG